MAIADGPIPENSLLAPGYGALFSVNPARGPVREVDPALYSPDQFTSQLIYSSEEIFLLSSRVPPRGAGPARHTHPVDQFLYCVKGELQLEIADEVYTMRPGSLAFFPAGTPHFNWNETDEEEIHIEVMLPGIPPTATIMYMEETSEVRGAGGGGVVHLEDDKWETRESLPGFAVQWLANPSTGSEHGIIYVGRAEQGGGFTRTHLHKFDQIYFVLEGAMQVELGLESYEAGPNTAVIIPAGVPHSNRNEGPDVEVHLTFNVPAPKHASTPDDPWDQLVELTRQSDHIA